MRFFQVIEATEAGQAAELIFKRLKETTGDEMACCIAWLTSESIHANFVDMC